MHCANLCIDVDIYSIQSFLIVGPSTWNRSLGPFCNLNATEAAFRHLLKTIFVVLVHCVHYGGFLRCARQTYALKLTLTLLCAGVELRLMFSLMDRVERGIDEMLRYLEEHIKNQGLADMIISATIITTVRRSCLIRTIFSSFEHVSNKMFRPE